MPLVKVLMNLLRRHPRRCGQGVIGEGTNTAVRKSNTQALCYTGADSVGIAVGLNPGACDGGSLCSSGGLWISRWPLILIICRRLDRCTCDQRLRRGWGLRLSGSRLIFSRCWRISVHSSVHAHVDSLGPTLDLGLVTVHFTLSGAAFWGGVDWMGKIITHHPTQGLLSRQTESLLSRWQKNGGGGDPPACRRFLHLREHGLNVGVPYLAHGRVGEDSPRSSFSGLRWGQGI